MGKSKSVGKSTRVNMSRSGVSFSRKTGPVTLNSRGTGSFRIAKGVSYKFGKRSSDASLLLLPLFFTLSLVSLVLRLMSSLLYMMVRVGLAGLKVALNWSALVAVFTWQMTVVAWSAASRRFGPLLRERYERARTTRQAGASGSADSALDE